MERLDTISPWLAGHDERNDRLDGDRHTDVAIIGAGFTGLSCALALRREGLDVVVLEAHRVGYGASGRNAGHLTPTIGKDLPNLARTFGRERVRALLGLAETAISHVESLIERFQIDCDYEPVGNVIAAVHPKQFRSLDRTAETAQRYGVPGTLLERKDMELRGLPRSFIRGYFEPHGGILHPGKYVRGLRRAALEAGADLYEETPVTSIEEDAPAILHTPFGDVRARNVVIATNAYTPQLGLLRSSAMRLQVQLFRTEPLSDAQLDAIGWQSRSGVYTAHEILESYRLTRDNRIVGGSKSVRYGFRGRPLPDVDPELARRLELVFRERFPELPDVRISDHWGGPIFMSLDFLPLVGRSGRYRNLLHAIAFAGHGIAQASYAGEMISDLLLEREGPGSALWGHTRLPLLPEPLRWLTFRLLNGIYSRLDERVDRAVAERDSGR